MKLLLGLFFAMLAIGAASFWAYRAAPEPAPCESTEIAQEHSADGRFLAEVFQVRCGGSLATHVALRPADAPQRARGDVFIAAGAAPVRLFWSSPRELVVESPAQKVLVEESSWRNVGVRLRLVR